MCTKFASTPMMFVSFSDGGIALFPRSSLVPVAELFGRRVVAAGTGVHVRSEAVVLQPAAMLRGSSLLVLPAR